MSSVNSDALLLNAWLQRQDERAFHNLVDRYAGLVHQAALRRSGDTSLAAEAAQATFITLAQKAQTLTGRESLAGWLHTTAVMKTRNLMRSHMREQRKLRSLMSETETEPAAETWHAMQPALDDALAELSDSDREALLLRYYRALDVREVATVLGISLDAAQKRLTRATCRLRDHLLARGCMVPVAGCALGLTLLAQDAKASTSLVSLFASNALKVSAAKSTISLTTVIMTTKQALPLAAAAMVLGGGIYFILQSKNRTETATANSEMSATSETSNHKQVATTNATKLHSTRQTKDNWIKLTNRYGDERTRRSQSVVNHMIELVNESVKYGEWMLLVRKDKELGGTRVEEWGQHFSLSNEQKLMVEELISTRLQKQLEQMKSLAGEISKSPELLAEELLASDAFVRDQMAQEEYDSIPKRIDSILKSTLDSELLSDSDPMNNEEFCRQFAALLEPPQAATFQTAMTHLQPASDPASGHMPDKATPKELEKRENQIKSCLRILQSMRQMADLSDGLPKK